MTSWHSFPKIYNLGHAQVQDLFKEPVLIEEKIDGSQFSFGLIPDETGELHLRVRSRGKEMDIDAPENLFNKAVETVKKLAALNLLTPGYTYRAEYLATPHHVHLTYGRVPIDHLIIFDINTAEETYLPYAEKAAVARSMGLEVVPLIYEGMVTSLEMFEKLIDRGSVLGGDCKIEGVVIKNYQRFGADKKALMGKYVSAAYREEQPASFREANPRSGDIVQRMIVQYKTDARWNKAIQHLKEAGKLESSARDIGLLVKEVPRDLKEEAEQAIKDALFAWAWPQIARASVGGLAEYYKDLLLKKQFEKTGVYPLTTEDKTVVPLTVTTPQIPAEDNMEPAPVPNDLTVVEPAPVNT